MTVLLQRNHKYMVNSIDLKTCTLNLTPSWNLTPLAQNLPIWHLLPWAWNNWQSQSPASVQPAPLRHSWGHQPVSKHSSLLVDTVFCKQAERCTLNLFIIKSQAAILAKKINQQQSPVFTFFTSFYPLCFLVKRESKVLSHLVWDL